MFSSSVVLAQTSNFIWGVSNLSRRIQFNPPTNAFSNITVSLQSTSLVGITVTNQFGMNTNIAEYKDTNGYIMNGIDKTGRVFSSFFMLTETNQANWPATPPTWGAIGFANSNGNLLVLMATNGAGTATNIWTKTNKLF